MPRRKPTKAGQARSHPAATQNQLAGPSRKYDAALEGLGIRVRQGDGWTYLPILADDRRMPAYDEARVVYEQEAQAGQAPRDVSGFIKDCEQIQGAIDMLACNNHGEELRAALVALVERQREACRTVLGITPPRWRSKSVWTAEDAKSAIDELIHSLLSQNPPTPPPETPPTPNSSALSVFPGGYTYRGASADLGGKPLQVLQYLAGATGQRATCAALLQAIWIDGDVTDETVKSAVSDARESLRQVLRQLELTKQDPIPCVDRGLNLAWRLDLPS